jgi:hypothetical protein
LLDDVLLKTCTKDYFGDCLISIFSSLLAFQKQKNVYNSSSANELPIAVLAFTITSSDRERGAAEQARLGIYPTQRILDDGIESRRDPGESVIGIY